MSSHHIVREKQEPALLILGLDYFSDELLGQLLEWSPTVIVTPSTAEKVNAFGIKIDMLVGSEVKDGIQSDIKSIPMGGDTLTEASLKFLVTKGYPSVNIITDSLVLKDFLLFVDKINLVIFYHQQKIYPIPSGFTKWKPAGDIIELASHASGLSISGLRKVDGTTYCTTHDGFFTIKFDQPYVFIAESIA
jgi:thiamine pyrophosphokinase